MLHGAGVDHREPEACFEPLFDAAAGFRRIYPDLPGMGRTAAPDRLRSAEDVLHTLLDFAAEVTGRSAYLLVGHSAGGYYAQAMAARAPEQIAGLALVCPLLPAVRDVPEHRRVVGSGELGCRGWTRAARPGARCRPSWRSAAPRAPTPGPELPACGAVAASPGPAPSA